MRQRVPPEDIARKHRDHADLTEHDCNDAYIAFIRQWPLYGSTIFDVLQGYTSTLPKNLWLAVNQHGIHILKRRDKEPLVTYEYKNIVNYRFVWECVCCIVYVLATEKRSICLNWTFQTEVMAIFKLNVYFNKWCFPFN